MILDTDIYFKSNSYNTSLEIPDNCPVCDGKMQAQLTSKDFVFRPHKHAQLIASFLCPICEELYMGRFSVTQYIEDKRQVIVELECLYPTTNGIKLFNEEISKISPMFSQIYNDALNAENQGLITICGMGYRKAVEFIIKDYLINCKNEDAELIKKLELGRCINEKIQDGNIKLVASRCAWLGNDQSHYFNKHPEVGIDILKKLIDAIVYWIHIESIKDEALLISKA